MKYRIIMGFLASLLAVVVPLMLLGMGEKPAALTENTPEPTAEASAAPEGRTVQAIVIHENRKTLTDEEITVRVTAEGSLQELSLHDYLIGVLMGEMPASFDLEALKAQAVAARTYTLKQVAAGVELSDDPGVCQAFLPLSGAEDKWGDSWEVYLNKLIRAVEETDGQVLTWGGELITATYFSCSGGQTESAQAVWGGDVPYLVSVQSPGEEEASGYASEVTVELSEFLAVLGVAEPGVSQVTYTDGGGVDTITIGGETFSGVDMRSLFGLRSTMFSMEVGATQVTFSVRGFGHRVGLSQYGAQAMAEQGYDYTEILSWYYTGVTLESGKA